MSLSLHGLKRLEIGVPIGAELLLSVGELNENKKQPDARQNTWKAEG